MKSIYKLSAISLAFLSFGSMAEKISGVVLDDQNQPLKGAQVNVVGKKKIVTTDSNGQFVLDFEHSKDLELHVQALGYSHKNIFLGTDHPESISVKLIDSVLDHVDVVGLPIHASSLESAQPISVISGDELRDIQASTLGETLRSEVGVQSSYFGPVASSPIIRGFDGPRVLITQNNLDVADVSRIGADHVVTAEVSTAQTIEILRGPSTLFYGSGAIGGVVNVIDNRIPTNSDTNGSLELSQGGADDASQIAFNLTTGNDNVAFYADGFYLDSENVKIPRNPVIESHDEHEEEHGNEAHDEDTDGHNEEHEFSGVLENSAVQSYGFTLGSSLLLDNGYVGISYAFLDREYGLLSHGDSHDEEHDDEHETDHQDEPEASEAHIAIAALKQDRWQVLSELSFNNAVLSAVDTRIGYTNYEHIEIENGAIGTTFKNESVQARLDFILQEIAGWHGAVTVDWRDSEKMLDGEEAFTPDSQYNSLAIAAIAEKHFGDVLIQAGARLENVDIKPTGLETQLERFIEHDELESIDFSLADSFDPNSYSIGLVWDYHPGYNIGVSMAHSERAPAVGEIYALGPHIGTNTFEIGSYFDIESPEHEEDEHEGDHEDHQDDNHAMAHVEFSRKAIKLETTQSLDLTWRKFEGDFGWVVNLFYNDIENYLYQFNTGLHYADIIAEGEHEEEHEQEHDAEHSDEGNEDAHEHHGSGNMPVYEYKQADAKIYGLEAKMLWQATDDIKVTALVDSLKGKLTNGSYLPRMSPTRYGLIADYQLQDWKASLQVMRYAEQTQVSGNETTTQGYTMVDLDAHYYMDINGYDLTAFAKIRNLTDEAARVHTSFLKNQTYLPGRGISFGLRLAF
ncbi:TonB-dependent receptor [Saccharobesus litoralis]|uniref:TonB-dependent receptor n=1 Tax=Saccharobesus litoralis TaxID=2172099 RepID=A0A2S0VLT3_9ALTE|nr:TonB-dependent receptor [Saccharobesus litoralis]AWB65168.1 TonB-dependent receptor [Saccharobesus litoralis]